jgi:hypothetical protein
MAYDDEDYVDDTEPAVTQDEQVSIKNSGWPTAAAVAPGVGLDVIAGSILLHQFIQVCIVTAPATTAAKILHENEQDK